MPNKREFTDDIREVLEVAYKSDEAHEVTTKCDELDLGYGKLVNLYSTCLRLSQAIRRCRNFQKNT